MTSIALRAEYRSDSPFVATARPRMSWIVETDEPEWSQRRAELRLDHGEAVVVDTSDHVFVDWPFSDLDDAPHEVRVRAQSAAGDWTPWSAPLPVRLAAVPDWKAPFIGLAAPDRLAQPVVLSRRIDIRPGLVDAVVHVAALGAATVSIDGTEIDDSVLGPGWTSYESRVLHDSVDVASRLAEGEHRLSIEVTGAWYTEEYGFGPAGTRVYGDQPSAALELHLRYADGSREVVRTGDDWTADGDGELVDSGIYQGECIDVRRVGAKSATPARIIRDDLVPVARISEPVRRTGELAAQEVLRSASGALILDFGQNLVGRLRITVDGPAGHEIVIRHAEVLDGGELATRPLRRAAATDRIILGGCERTIEPRGTFHGFRYAEITGWPGEFDPERVRAVVLHSDMRRTGWFSSSHDGLNRLHENVVWSMRGNFLSVPTDCPQRDERMGWTGDAQVFAPTAVTLFDSAGFLANWLEDLAIEQSQRDGVVPFVVPDVLRFPVGPMAAWGDAAAVIPDVLAERLGDTGIVARQLDSMRSWVDAIVPFVGPAGVWENHNQFGDWLDPDAPPDAPGAAKTARDIVATAHLFRSASLVAGWMFRLDVDGAEVYRALAERTRDAFCAHYVTPAGRMASDSPTAYALALQFGIVTDRTVREKLGERLVDLTRRNGYRIATGFVGTPLILDALTDTGHADAAVRLLLQTDFPSWLYPVTMGATTIWERWDSLQPDGAINPGEMTSFNHYAFGAVADWLYRSLAGISPADDAYRVVRFAPVVCRELDHVEATVLSPSGRVEGGWRREGARVRLRLRVPAHATAKVELPDGRTLSVGSGEHAWTILEQSESFAPVTFWSTFRDVADDAEARAAIWTPIEAFSPELAATLRRRIEWTLQDPLPAGLFDVPPHVQEQIAARLSALNERRGSRSS